jgi:hypothetical protein
VRQVCGKIAVMAGMRPDVGKAVSLPTDPLIAQIFLAHPVICVSKLLYAS